MLIIWDYFGVIAQDHFWYTTQELADGRGMGDEVRKLKDGVDLGRVSWAEYTSAVAHDIGVPLVEVRERYQHHDIEQQVVLAVHSLPRHKHVVLSNASASYLRPIMDRLGLNKLFSDVFVSSDIGYAKPDPRAFKHVLNTLHSAPEDAIMIDDSVRNIESAADLGIKGIVFKPHQNVLEDLKKLIA